MFIRAPADGERYTWATMGEAAAGNLQEHTGLKTYPKGGGGEKKEKRKKKIRKIRQLKGKSIASGLCCFSAFGSC